MTEAEQIAQQERLDEQERQARQLRAERTAQLMQASQQPQQGSGGSPLSGVGSAASIYSSISGGSGGGAGATGGTTAASGSGMGAGAMGGIIAAAIGAQHYLSNKNKTEIDGVESGDAFSGQFGTEPWFGKLRSQWGLDPSAGEEFDAQVKNKDWNEAWKKSYAMSDYWADPAKSWIATGAEKLGGDKYGTQLKNIANPMGQVFKKIF